MATRRELERKRIGLHDALRTDCVEGRFAPGAMLPPMRELAAQYGVSTKVAWRSVQALVDEGVLHTVPRQGTFVGKPPGQFDVYLLTFPYNPGDDEYLALVQMGFEERVAQLGGISLRLTEAEAWAHSQRGELPPLAGIYRAGGSLMSEAWWPKSVPAVQFGSYLEDQIEVDRIHFDDIAGGAQAARHLLAMGHRKIGFLGLHDGTTEQNGFTWSADRELGWLQTMESAGLNPAGLTFRSDTAVPSPIPGMMPSADQCILAYATAKAMVATRRELTAIITANVHAAEALFWALEESGAPDQSWPAVLCFDDLPSSHRSVVSYVRLPWNEVGRTAAQVLWERKTGQLAGSPRKHLVKMQIIPRLTCRPDWAASVLARTDARHRTASPLSPRQALEAAQT